MRDAGGGTGWKRWEGLHGGRVGHVRCFEEVLWTAAEMGAGVWTEAPVSAQRHRKAHRSAQTSSGTPSITRAAASAEAGDKTRGVDKMVKSLYRPPMPRRCRRRG